MAVYVGNTDAAADQREAGWCPGRDVRVPGRSRGQVLGVDQPIGPASDLIALDVPRYPDVVGRTPRPISLSSCSGHLSWL